MWVFSFSSPVEDPGPIRETRQKAIFEYTNVKELYKQKHVLATLQILRLYQNIHGDKMITQKTAKDS